MDAVKFTNEAMRMCNKYWSKCWGCPAGDGVSCKLDSNYDGISAEGKVSIVEQWAKKHPVKTRQSVFLEQYPEARLSEDGILLICPRTISAEYRDEDGTCNIGKYGTCADCKRQFWLAEVEE